MQCKKLDNIQENFTKNKIFLLLLLSCVFLVPKSILAQSVRLGINAGMLGSRYTIHENKPNKGVIVRQGDVFIGPSFGMVGILTTSREQTKRNPSVLQSFLKVDINYCMCGGNVEILETKGSETISRQQYQSGHLNINLAYHAEAGKVIFMVGPTVSQNSRRRVNTPDDGIKTLGTKINEFVVGGELGVGVKKKNFALSGRYYMSLSQFAEPTSILNTAYNLHEAKLVLSYYFLDSNREKNYKSIYWD